MSFLDHLEELRQRLFKSFAAIAVGCVAGWFLVDRWHAVAFLKGPIAPYLPDGKLIVLSPTEPLMIAFKLAVILGCVLASPVVLWQVWSFLSPALYARERKVVIPVLVVGAILFLSGAILSFLFVVPQALRVLFSFQSDSLATMITFEKYFDFITQLMLAMGISFELPLVMVILATFGIVTPTMVSGFRRVAIIILLFAGAILSPGTDVLSMMMLSVPMILLYEVGYIGVIIASRARARATASAGLLLLLCLAGGGRAAAQVPAPVPKSGRHAVGLLGNQGVADSTQKKNAPLDTARARRMGLPTAPSRDFPATDSVLDELLARPGYEATRFLADSATLFVPERRIDLQGRAMTRRNGSTLEAARIGYEEASCEMDARGDPKVFDQGTVMVGEGLRYNTCERRAVVSGALTNFQQGGVEWFMRGTLSQDSTARRIYASSSQITSCDLPIAHYHFSARQSKWISKSVLVARPAILYVRDVPTLWLPFIFQDGRPGRRSGILVPQFGINDIVRPSRNYSRQVTNVGYFWAPNDYFDASVRLDWYAGRQTQAGVGLQYRWLDRAVNGSMGFNRLSRDDGSSSIQFQWNHDQSFSLTSKLNMNLDFVSNTAARNRGAISPLSNTQQIISGAKYDKRFAWGTFTMGGNRRQSLTDGSITQEFPAVTFSPNPIDLPGNVTWSPAMSFTEDRSLNTPEPGYAVVTPSGGLDTLGTRADSRTTRFNLDTPLRFGGFTWSNSIGVTDFFTNQVQLQTAKVPDLSTPDPNDSVTVDRTTAGDFQTGVDWNTQINLPILFRGSWKVTPGLGIANVANGPFLLRNRLTGGDFIAQTKRASLSLTANPTFFAFLPGFGPIARIRHSVLPTLSFRYSPEGHVPGAYARAIAPLGQAPVTLVHQAETASLGLTQTFEAKGHPAPNDTSATPNVRKYRLLSLTTSAVSYDFEQAKLPGRTGWTTQTLSNSFQSDLIPGLNVSLTHDLWKGTVGTDSAVFAPYLTGVSASFGVNAGTFRGLARLFGLGPDSLPATARRDEPPPTSYVAQDPTRARSGSFGSSDQVQRTGHSGFTSSFNFSLERTRPVAGVTADQPNHASLGFSTNFSPTPFWSMSWQSQYNFTQHRFESQVIRLERDLHEWRASFNFVRNPNGNVSFYFNIALLDLPDIKFDYNQTTLPR